MIKSEILEALKQMFNTERLKIIEFTSWLMREEIRKNKREQKTLLEVDNDVLIQLNPNSAEAKALERLASPIADNEWIVVDNVGQKIDMNAVKEQFKQSEYKRKISC